MGVCCMYNIIALRRIFQRSLLIFIILSIGHSYAMLIETYSQCFVENFSGMTFAQARENFDKHDQIVQNSIVRKINSRSGDNTNKAFAAVFYMATQLPKDMQKLI